MKNALLHSLLALVLLGSISADPQMPLAVNDQLPLFLKILGYETHLAAGDDPLVLGVLYQQRYRPSALAKEALAGAQRATAAGRPVRVVPIRLEPGVDVAAALRAQRVEVLYVTPLRAYEVSSIAAAVRAEGVLTLTGVPDYLDAGLSVSLGLKGSKPIILINLPAAEAEGARFHSQLLKLAQVRR